MTESQEYGISLYVVNIKSYNFAQIKKMQTRPVFESWTSRTLSENHTPKLTSLDIFG